MRKVWLGLATMLVAGVVLGVQRAAVQRVEPTFLETGNASRGFSVSVGSTTPVLVYTPATPNLINYPTSDRVMTIANSHGFKLFCATTSAIAAVSTTRWAILSSSTFVTHTLVPTFCIYDVTASTKEVHFKVDYDTAD